MTRNYREEFPDFDPATMPAIPAGFIDTSHAWEGCPSFSHSTAAVRLHIDTAGTPDRFTAVVGSDTADDPRAQFSTDNWNGLLSYVAAYLNRGAFSEPTLATFLVDVSYPDRGAVVMEFAIRPGIVCTGLNVWFPGAVYDGQEEIGETIAYLINEGPMMEGTTEAGVSWRVQAAGVETLKRWTALRSHFTPADEAEHQRANRGSGESDYCRNCSQPFMAHTNGQCPQGE